MCTTALSMLKLSAVYLLNPKFLLFHIKSWDLVHIDLELGDWKLLRLLRYGGFRVLHLLVAVYSMYYIYRIFLNYGLIVYVQLTTPRKQEWLPRTKSGLAPLNSLENILFSTFTYCTKVMERSWQYPPNTCYPEKTISIIPTNSYRFSCLQHNSRNCSATSSQHFALLFHKLAPAISSTQWC